MEREAKKKAEQEVAAHEAAVARPVARLQHHLHRQLVMLRLVILRLLPWKYLQFLLLRRLSAKYRQ